MGRILSSPLQIPYNLSFVSQASYGEVSVLPCVKTPWVNNGNDSKGWTSLVNVLHPSLVPSYLVCKIVADTWQVVVANIWHTDHGSWTTVGWYITLLQVIFRVFFSLPKTSILQPSFTFPSLKNQQKVIGSKSICNVFLQGVFLCMKILDFHFFPSFHSLCLSLSLMSYVEIVVMRYASKYF